MPYKDKVVRAAYHQQHYLKNREKKRAYSKQYREANHEQVKADMRKDYATNREKRLAAKREHYENNKEIYAERSRQWRLKNKEKLTKDRAAYVVANRDVLLSKAMFARSGFTTETKQQTIVEQNGECAICRTELALLPTKDVHADHCHATGKTRGVLCGSCNLGIGKLKDDTEVVRRALEYLEKHRASG